MARTFNSVVLIIEGCFMGKKRGSHVRIFEQIKYMENKNYKLIVYSYRDHAQHPWTNSDIDEFRNEFQNVELVLDEYSELVRLFTRVKNIFYQLLPSMAKSVSNFSVPGTPGWRALCDVSNAVFIFHFVDTLSLINGRPKGRVLIETHDIKSVKTAKVLRQNVWGLRIMGKLRSEAAMLGGADAYIAISPADLSFFQHIAPGTKYFYIPSYAQDEPRALAEQELEYDLLFIGADNEFNVRGILKFIEDNWKLLETFNLAVVGAVGLNAAVISCASKKKNISLLGVVDDLASVYARTKSVIAPVEGTGLKIKVVEALAYGRPVFGSRHAIEGLPPGWKNAVFEIDCDFIEELLRNADLYKSAAKAAVSYYRVLTAAGDLDKFSMYLKDYFSQAFGAD